MRRTTNAGLRGTSAWLHLVLSTKTLVGDEVGYWFALPARLRRRLNLALS